MKRPLFDDEHTPGLSTGSPLGPLLTRCQAAVTMLPTDAAFSQYTAARFYAAPVPDESHLHINTRHVVEPRIKGIVAHRVQVLGKVHQIGGVRVTPPARTFVDLASRLDLPSLVALGDVLARRCEGGVSELETEVRLAGRRRGVGLAREAVPLLDPTSESPMESRLRVLLVLAGLPRPESQVVVFDENGIAIARIDLVFPPRVGVEYEGSQHQDRDQYNKDIHRYEKLDARDWIIVRVTADDIYLRPEVVVARVRAAIARATAA